MSRTVLNVLEEGIKKAGIDDINETYKLILNDFYANCCVIDPKRNLTPKNGKYNMMYSCFDRRRVSSTLEINISADDVISINEINDEIKNNLILKPETVNPIKKRYELLRIGILTLEKISMLDCNEDISSVSKRLEVNSTGGFIQTFKDCEEQHCELFSYVQSNNTLYFYPSINEYKDLSLSDAVKKVYSIFKEKR